MQNNHNPLNNVKTAIRIIRVAQGLDSQLKGPENINKIIEANFPSLKKEMVIKVQEAYRTTKSLDQTCHIIIKTHNAENKERLLKFLREKTK